MSSCCNSNEKDHSRSYRRTGRKSCTDCICFLLFILFVLGLTTITVITSLDKGLLRMIFGYDSNGTICNQESQITQGRGFVFYFDYLKPIESKKVCVKSCPDQFISNISDYKIYSSSKNISLCFYNIPIGEYKSEFCPPFPIFSSKALAHRCLPEPKKFINSKLEGYSIIINKFKNITFNDIIDPSIIKLWIVQLHDDLAKLALISGVALVVAFILVFLLRFIAKIMVIVILLALSLGFIGLTTWLWYNYAEMLRSTSNNSAPFLIYSIISTVATVILILVIFFMRKRIGLVIRLFAEAQKCIAKMNFILFLPFATFLVLIMFIFYWLSTAMMIYSFGSYDSENITTMNISISKKNIQTVMWVYHFVALIWITEFIFGCQALIVASSVSKWYFTRDKKSLSAPICSSVKNLIVYHMGSVAFGSFLITLVRIPRYILMYFHDKITASKSSIAEFCSKACICCFWCLEKFIKSINSNAYTIIAIEGTSFCASAQKAFIIILENSLRIVAINTVGDMMLFLSKILVSAITLAISVPILEIYTFDIAKTEALSILYILIISFLIAHCFFTVYEMIIDALLVCFCEDCKANDGTEERPYYMTSSLREFIDETSSTHININK